MTGFTKEESKRGGLVGGAVTREKYGREHFEAIGRKGGAAMKAKGTNYAALGAMGGNATKAKGADFKAIGKTGAVAMLRNARNKALEEAARACADVQAEHRKSGSYPMDMGGLAEECARRIRDLKR